MGERLANNQLEVDDFVRRLILTGSPLLNLQWLKYSHGIVYESKDQLCQEICAAAATNPNFRSHPYFDARWYLGAVKLPADLSFFHALQHYLTEGEAAGFSPSPFLPILRYSRFLKRHNIQVKRTLSILEQFIQSDSENYFATTAFHFDCARYVRDDHRSFDREWAKIIGLTPFGHYVLYGSAEGRRPNPVFDEEWYLTKNESALDAVLAGTFPNGFSHYLNVGEDKNLSPSPFFDPDVYLQRNPDLAELDDSLFYHFWTNGRFERRCASNTEASSLVAAHFPAYFPDCKDVILGENVVRREGDFRSMLEGLASGAAYEGQSVLNLLLNSNGHTQNRDKLELVFAQKASPLVKIDSESKYTAFTQSDVCIYVSGIAFLPFGKLIKIELELDDQFYECPFVRTPRLDYLSQITLVSGDNSCIEAGFLCRITLPKLEASGDLCIPLHFIFEIRAQEAYYVDSINVSVEPHPQKIESNEAVQVVMATFNPHEVDLEIQLGSILSQDVPSSVVISDDGSRPISRNHLYFYNQRKNVYILSSDRNRGFVMNFERGLRAVSPSARIIFLSDQDDKWNPNKVFELAKCIKDSKATCAFSDMRIVKGDGRLISDTFWAGRKVHYTSPTALSIANTVTGAASAVPRSVLETLLPFPQYRGIYHDQWLSVCCSALGSIIYLDKALYDYRQHGGNVLGYSGSRNRDATKWRMISKILRRALKLSPAIWTAKELDCILECIGSEIALYQRFILLGEALERIPIWSDKEEQNFAASVCAAIAGSQQVNLKSILRTWRKIQSRAGGEDFLIGQDYLMESLFITVLLIRGGNASIVDMLRKRQRERDAAVSAHSKHWLNEEMTDFERKIQPLKISSVKTTGSLSLTMLIPELNHRNFFGGYYSKIALAQQLIKLGMPVRLVLLDQTAVYFPEIAQIACAFPELATGLDNCEIIGCGDRTRRLEIGPRDAVMATTWWSAHVAENIRRTLNRRRFLYLVQEYEPFTFSLGTWYRGAEQSYEFPYMPIFSTEMLRDFFQSICGGGFSRAYPPAKECLYFRNPIIARGEVTKKVSRKRMVLFYARPQAHAARNMYDFGVAALRKFAESLGDKCPSWEFIGVGGDMPGEIPLTDHATLNMIPKVGADEYMSLLAEAGVGLALMYTPHPSLVPLEMARAGVLTVTNSCMSKDAESFRDISDGIVVADPAIDSISQALSRAAVMFNEGKTPSFTDWPVTIEEAFPSAWLQEFVAVLEDSLKC